MSEFFVNDTFADIADAIRPYCAAQKLTRLKAAPNAVANLVLGGRFFRERAQLTRDELAVVAWWIKSLDMKSAWLTLDAVRTKVGDQLTVYGAPSDTVPSHGNLRPMLRYTFHPSPNAPAVVTTTIGFADNSGPAARPLPLEMPLDSFDMSTPNNKQLPTTIALAGLGLATHQIVVESEVVHTAG